MFSSLGHEIGFFGRMLHLLASIPIRGVYFLNLFQSLIVIFIICDIERKRRKAETREVLSARPIGNRQSLLGEFLGILVPFLAVDIIFILVCVVIGIIIPDSPVNLWVNLFYLLTLVLPTLVFIIGLSLLVNKLFKQPFISWVTLTAFLYFACNYWVTPLYGILDFRGSLLPSSFSTLIGFVYLEDYLLQRFVFLFLGIGFLCFGWIVGAGGLRFFQFVDQCRFRGGKSDQYGVI